MAIRTFDELLSLVYPNSAPQLNLMENLNFYTALSANKQKEVNDSLLKVLKTNFPFIEYNNTSGCKGMLVKAYTGLASYKASMQDIVETTSPMFAEIFSFFPDSAYTYKDFDLNSDPLLMDVANFSSERTAELLTYRGVSVATSLLLSTSQTFESLIAHNGDDLYDTARLIMLASFTGTEYLFNLDKPLLPASLNDKDKKLMVNPVSFFPNRLYGVPGSIASNMFNQSHQVVDTQVALLNIFESIGENWVERIVK